MGNSHGGSSPPSRTTEVALDNARTQKTGLNVAVTELYFKSQRTSGCSSVVERHVANVNVVGSTPITRSICLLGDNCGKGNRRL